MEFSLVMAFPVVQCLPRGCFCGKKRELILQWKAPGVLQANIASVLPAPGSGQVCSVTRWVRWKMADYSRYLRQRKKNPQCLLKYPLNISVLLSWEPKAFLKSHRTQPGREHPSAHGHCGCFLFLGIASTRRLDPEDAIYQKAIYSPC